MDLITSCHELLTVQRCLVVHASPVGKELMIHSIFARVSFGVLSPEAVRVTARSGISGPTCYNATIDKRTILGKNKQWYPPVSTFPL